MRDMPKRLLLLCLLFPAACTPAQPQAARPHPAATMAASHPAIDVSALGRRIWANECAGSVSGLVSWNAGEAFPSLGIGHFIWYPAGYRGPFEESFPHFVDYARRQGVAIPSYLEGSAPWPNKAAFLRDSSGLANRMRQWLASHVEVQTRYIMARSRAALPSLLRASTKPDDVLARYRALASTTQGMYCLVDYVNFKGEGIRESERYNGRGWGLLQVLEEMQGRPQGRAATAEFARAAAAVMRRRVANAPASRQEQRWLPGWLNRCATYR